MIMSKLSDGGAVEDLSVPKIGLKKHNFKIKPRNKPLKIKVYYFYSRR